MVSGVATLDDLIPATEAARILGVSIATLHRKAAAGEVPEVAKLPGLRGARLFRRSDVEALLAPTTGDAA